MIRANSDFHGNLILASVRIEVVLFRASPGISSPPPALPDRLRAAPEVAAPDGKRAPAVRRPAGLTRRDRFRTGLDLRVVAAGPVASAGGDGIHAPLLG